MWPALFESAAFVHLTVTFAGDKMEEGTGWINYKYIGSSKEHWMVQCFFIVRETAAKILFKMSIISSFPRTKGFLGAFSEKAEKENLGASPYFVFCGWHIHRNNEDTVVTLFCCKIVEPPWAWHFPRCAVLVIQISTSKTSNGFVFNAPLGFLLPKGGRVT